MSEKITTILDVQLDTAKVAQELNDLSRQIANVRKEQKELDEEYKEGKISATEYTKSTAAMKDELSWLQKQQKGVIATQKLLTSETDTYADTLNGQRQKLADMQKAYDQLDKATRESKGGKEFLKALKEQSDSVKKLEEATGRAQRNVGNYGEALKQAGVGMGGLLQKTKALLANPIVAVIAACSAALNALIKAFKSSEDRVNEMRRAFTPLQAVLDVVKQIFDAIAKQLSGVVQIALEKVTDGVKWLFSALDKLGKKFGKDWGLSEAFEKAAENTKKATDAAIAYEKASRRLVESEAKAERDIAELRAKAAEKDKYNAEERIKMLEQARDKELALAKERQTVAKLNLKALEAEAENTENTKEVNDRIAQARAEVIRTETAYLNTERSLNKQIAAFRKEEASEAEKLAKESEKNERDSDKNAKARLEYQRELKLKALGDNKEYSEEAYRINMQYFADLVALYDKDSADYYNALKAKEQYDEQYTNKRKELEQKAQEFIASFNERESLENQYQQQLELLNAYYSQGLLSTEEYEATRTQIQNKYTQERTKLVASELSSLSGAFKSMSDMLGGFAQKSKEAAAAQKAFSLMSIITSEASSIAQGALAISEGVASAAMIQFPGNIPAIISIVATIMGMLASVTTSFMQAKKIFSQADAGKFEHGGTIDGTSYTGDKLIAHVNSGEGIYTGKQANNLLQEIANNPARGGFDIESFATATAAAVAALPAPVMAYEEYRSFEREVTTYKEIASV